MAGTLNEKIDELSNSAPEEQSRLPKDLEGIAREVEELSAVQEEKMESRSGLFKKALDIGGLAASLYLQLKLLPAKIVATSMIPTFGFIMNKYKNAKKERKKFTWNKLIRTFNHGQRMGYGDIAIFSLPGYLKKLSSPIFSTGSAFSFLSASSTVQRILAGTATTLLFNPLLIPPYNLLYNTLSYFQNRIGFFKALTSPKKIKGYLRYMYYTKVKGKWLDETKSVFKNLFPLHWVQMTLHKNLYTRLLQSIFVNNWVYARVMEQKDKRKKKKYETGNYYNHPPPYAGQPAYAT